MSGWSWAWAILIAAGVALEIVAIVRPQSGDTLSEQVWDWLRYGADQVPTPAVWLARFVVGALLVWLVPHWLFPSLGI